MDLSVQELRFLAGLSAQEGKVRESEQELWDQHMAARKHAEETGQPVRGVCPTMFRNPHHPPKDLGFDPVELAAKLNQGAAELERQGPYR